MKFQALLTGGCALGLIASGLEIWRRFGYKKTEEWLADGLSSAVSKTIAAPIGKPRVTRGNSMI
jgi:hypothetical protein